MSEPAAPCAVLFDLDGTFADTFPDLEYALAQALAERGLARPAADVLRARVSHGARAMAEHACRAGGQGCALDSVLARFLEIYGHNLARRTRLVDGMQELLDELGQRGIAWGIVTNKLGRYAEPLMAALDRDHRAGCIVSGDSTANAKPHPQPLVHACRLLGRAPGECVYVGDAENDVLAAHRAGMPCVVVLYGYIAPGDDPNQWRADALIDSPGALLEWIDAR